jgi:hypothetical protein
MKTSTSLLRATLLAGLWLIRIISSGQQSDLITAKNGLTTAHFKVDGGQITVYLPEIMAATPFSGSIHLSPDGDNVKELDKNRHKLESCYLTLANFEIPVKDQSFTLTLADSVRGDVPVILTDVRGRRLFASWLPVLHMPVVPAPPYVPSYAVAGDPSAVVGRFNGDLSDTRLTIQQRAAALLAETPVKLYLRTPDDLSGKVHLECSDAGTTQSADLNILQLHLAVGKSDMSPGETTDLQIQLTGLEGLEADVPMTVTNLDPENITLEGGEKQQTVIHPPADAPGGTYSATLPIRALRRGTFNITVDVEPPGETTTSEALCNCYINEHSYLLPEYVCQALGGNCNRPPESGEMPEQYLSASKNPPVFSVEAPSEITPETGTAQIQVTCYPEDDLAGVIFSYRPLTDESWTVIGTDDNPSDGWGTSWNAPLGEDGTYILRVIAVDRDDSTGEQQLVTQVHMDPLAVVPPGTPESVFTVSEGAVREAEDEARRTDDSLRAENARRDALDRRLRKLRESERANRQAAGELARIDVTLEAVPRVYRDSLQRLVDSLDRLRSRLPATVDTAALRRAADDAAARLKACRDRLEALKKEKEELEKQRDDLKKQMDDALDAMDRLHLGNGWIGGHGYHSDGRYWFGYVGDENSNTDIGEEAYALQRRLRTLQKPYLVALDRLKNLPGEIARAQAACDRMQQALQQAAAAVRDGNLYAGTEVSIEEICRQIRSLLQVLRQWCADHPGDCHFGAKLRDLAERCPKTPDELNAFFREFNDIIKQKQEQESAYRDEADRQNDEAGAVRDRIGESDRRADALRRQQERESARADSLRQQREHELEQARQRRREQEEAERAESIRRNNPTPQPRLSEPVNPRNDQLKFQAQRVFRELYRDNLIERGPCDCITKALALANNTNTIVSDIIGRLGVGVAFAPLEALPGISLAGRLGIGAVKALAGALYGGQSFPEELAANVFKAIGGEIFPKLVGNELAGHAVNELATEGLKAIMEKEGVRTVAWEGTTHLRECGEVSGKTVMLVNPNTGWVVIMIKVDGCPLVIVKYKVNDSGVPVTTPTVETVG